ncbi:MAG: hypothetical protein FWH48_03690 [Oscillospiraceae bacterium]|nr:hypothetical protein [Oscillospiraceae bacterium]
MGEKINLMLIEDTNKWIKIFQDEICKDARFEYQGHATSKDSGVAMALEFNPDVVVVDIFLNQLSNHEYGIEAAKEIRFRTNAKIVFFTADPENGRLSNYACKISFASGYIRKSDYKEYADEIHNAVTKCTPFKASIIENVRNQLTYAENDVLSRLIAGTIIGTKDKSETFDVKVISKHKTQIYKKLGLIEIPEREREKSLIKIFQNW